MINKEVLTTDVVIIGGGVIGCMIAYFLRQANLQVTVIEQGEIGAGASSAAAGLLAPLGPLSGPGPFADLLLSSFARFSSLVPELEAASGLKVGYEQTGALRIVRNSKRVARLQKRYESWLPLGLEIVWLSGEEARQHEPLLAPDICGAVYASQESQINALQFVKALEQVLCKRGVRMYRQTTVSNIQHTSGLVTGVLTSRGDLLLCRHVVVAAGAWSSQVTSLFDISLPVRPVRGQMLAFRQPESPLRHTIFGEAIYLIPRGDFVLVGATKEEAGFTVQVTNEGISWLQSTALRLVPALQACEIEHTWSGLRPATPDSQPIFGTLPGWGNVILATGHNSVGVMLSPVTGEGIAEYIVTGSMPVRLKPFTLERFCSE